MKTNYRVRDLCRQSLVYLNQNSLLPSFLESGPFRKPLHRGRPVFRPEQVMLAHYCLAEGPLYSNPQHWKLAFDLIQSFRSGGPKKPDFSWTLERCYGSFGQLEPRDLYRMVLSSFTRCGFIARDADEARLRTQFELVDSCKVMKLPEPYGKWLQIQQARPRWDDPVELKALVECQVWTAVQPKGSALKYQTFVNMQLSTLMPTLVLTAGELIIELILKGKPQPAASRRSLETAILRVVRERMASSPWSRR